MLYFSFTSLSTVGFGDYFPQSNSERVVGCFVLLFGVAIFSWIMGDFIQILHQFQEINSDLDEGDNLSKFLGLMKRFNAGKELPEKLKINLQIYF